LRCICRTRQAAPAGSGHDCSPIFISVSVRCVPTASIRWGSSPCTRLSPARTTNRVGGTHCCVPPPSELGGRAFPAPSSSKPRRAQGRSEVLALLAFAMDSRRRQWACTRRS
jgi:hypothetical protein